MSKLRLPTLTAYAACSLFAATHLSAKAQTVRYQDVEAVAASDVALYICAQAYPAGLAKMKVKIEQSLQDLAAPAAALRQAKTYAGLYNTQLNTLLSHTKKEREAFCKAAAD